MGITGRDDPTGNGWGVGGSANDRGRGGVDGEGVGMAEMMLTAAN